MKLKLSLLIAVLCVLSFSYSADAAFVVKRARTEESAKATTTTHHKERVSNRKELMNNLTTLKNLAMHEGDHDRRPRKDTSGWEGIVALCCGILGLFTGWLAIPAIIFGAIGMSHGKAHRGMAIAGLVMGIVTIVVVLFLILVLASFFGFWLW